MSRQSGDLACGVLHENGTSNIGVKIAGESGVKELTEGDSFDTAPCWMPSEKKQIVFQTAGVGRNRDGHFLALGPFSLQKLDIEGGEMNTLLEDERFDYLAPHCGEDGSLYYIRRPYSRHERIHPGRVLKDAVLFPFRLLFAVFQFLNFFSAMFTGKRLTSAGGPDAKQMNLRQMMIWGNLVHAQAPAKAEDEAVDLVPKSWELRKRGSNEESKALASGVLAYDVAADGTIIYTNGNALFFIHPDGRKEHVLNEAMIEQVFFIEANLPRQET